MMSFHVVGIPEPVTLKIGDEEPRENQILVMNRILIQLQKLLLAFHWFEHIQVDRNRSH